MDKKIKVKKYTGVYLNRNRWVTYIYYKKVYYLGSFKNKEDAIKIREEAKKMRGENFEDWYQNWYQNRYQVYKEENKDYTRSTKLDIPIGTVFGKLKVIRKTRTKDKHGNYLWKCQCECGNIKNISGSSLRRGYIKSCGCLRLNRKKKLSH